LPSKKLDSGFSLSKPTRGASERLARIAFLTIYLVLAQTIEGFEKSAATSTFIRAYYFLDIFGVVVTHDFVKNLPSHKI